MRLKNYLFCKGPSDSLCLCPRLLYVCSLSLLYSINGSCSFLSSNIYLAGGTYRKEGRKQVSSYFNLNNVLENFGELNKYIFLWLQ